MSAPTSTSDQSTSSRVATFIPGFIEESSCTAADLFLDRKQDNLYVGTKRKWAEYHSDIHGLGMSSEKPFKRVKATEVCVKSEVETIIARLEKRFDQFGQKNEGKITEIQNKITEQQTQITELQNKITEQQKQITEQQTQITELQNKITEQQKQITEQQKQITEIDTNWNFSLAYIQLTGEPRSNKAS